MFLAKIIAFVSNVIFVFCLCNIKVVILLFAGILSSYPSGSLQLKGLKQAIHGYELLPVLITSLKLDFTKMPEGWRTSARLATLLS